MSFGIRPLADKLVIKKMEAEEKTASGIVLPGQAKEQPQMAEVIAAGPGTKDEPMEVKEGDTVIYRKYGGDDIKFKGEEYMIVSQSDILAVVNKEVKG